MEKNTSLYDSQEYKRLEEQLKNLLQQAEQIRLEMSPHQSLAPNHIAAYDTLLEELNHFYQEFIDQEHKQQYLQALAEVGHTVNSSLELDQVLQAVMDSIIHLTGAERSFLMLKDERDQLFIRIGRKWERDAITESDYYISSTIAQRVVSEGHAILTNNAQEDPRFNTSKSIANYHLRSILCVPLNVKQKNIGVIYADNRVQSGVFSESDAVLLSSLADQAAIAIENATLFEKVQRNAQEISEAYDATIQGWARALEFRDYETQGHCQRVTELTMQLAIALNVPEEDLIHIKRGAILHDVGKMGISDHILLKPGPLTEEEWKIIRLHPEYGYEFLKQIPFLRQALPIVRYHHEHWDGNGYPKGLKGEQIPFPARIFSIADVWDALVHSRPYKRPWSKDEALFYIESQAGELFDPQVVQTFLDLIQRKTIEYPFPSD